MDDPFPKTHDIEDLVERAQPFSPEFATWKKAGAILTPYVAAFRYPGGFEEPMPSREEFDEALNLAQAMYGFVLDHLPPDARSC